jgi:hypothetical protein
MSSQRQIDRFLQLCLREYYVVADGPLHQRGKVLVTAVRELLQAILEPGLLVNRES